MIASFLPIWLLAAVGYLSGRTRILGDQGELVLGRFVFHIAMPASLFATLSGAKLDRFSGWAIGTPFICRVTTVLTVIDVHNGEGRRIRVRDLLLLAVVVCSALPTAQNVFIFAREYGLRTALVRNAIVASSALSMLSLLLATWLLGPGGHGN